ncbi:MAG: hypothetical protein WC832_10280, partial [Anaerolineales bacterium]
MRNSRGGLLRLPASFFSIAGNGDGIRIMDFVAADLFPGDDPSNQPVGWLPPRSRKGPPVAAESRFYATDHHSPSGQLSKKADEKLEEK